jgi:tRNA-modifying protein YgfZ
LNSPPFANEYFEAVKGAGSMAQDRWNTVQVTGGDRATFLHNMCTNDIRGLSPGGGGEAFFTDVKGKIVAHAFVLVGDDAIQLVAVPDSAARLIAHLDRYIIREDVQLADATSMIDWTLVVGAESADAIGPVASSPMPDLQAAWSHAVLPLGRNSPVLTQLVRCNLPWCGGYLVGSGSDHTDALRGNLVSGGAIACSHHETWQAIRVESAWPLWGVDFDAANLPQEVNRDALAIHFRKGCYLGQETVARIDALGHVNRRLMQVQFAGDSVPPSGAELLRGDQVVGRITSACWSPSFNSPLALAMVHRGSNDVGTRVRWDEVDAEVIAKSPSPTSSP